jgi:hypothetical protein
MILALISPAAQPYLEQMAQECHELTKKRFGKPFRCMRFVLEQRMPKYLYLLRF